MPPRRSSSKVHPKIHGSRPAGHRPLVDGGLLPGGYGDVFARLAQKARPGQKRITSTSSVELGQESRDAQAASLRAEEVRKTATARNCKQSSPKEGEDEADCSTRRRTGRQKSLAGSLGRPPRRGDSDASRSKTRGRTHCLQ